MSGNRSIKFAVVVAMLIGLTAALALAAEHATEGVITRVDSAGKKLAVRAADGTEEVFRFTEKTAVHGAKEAKADAVDTYLAGKEGTHVVVHYSGEGAEKVAVAIHDVGKEAMKVAKGTIARADKAAHTITVKTEDGAEETYHLAKDAAVDSARGVVKGTEYVAKNGERVTVHYTEEAGRKVVHLVKHI